MADDEEGAVERLSSSSTTNESLSQFVAKVLDQLSLSAWLPSAALVLSLAFLVNLRGTEGAFGPAVAAFADYPIAAGLFLFASVVVLTMVTQAFEFEAIRFLEGYWGPRAVGEWAADVGCALHTWRRSRLVKRRKKWDTKAFEKAHFSLSTLVSARGDTKTLTRRDLEILLARRTGTKVKGMTRSELEHALKVPWTDHAPARYIRRADHLRNAAQAYPRGNRVLPTRLGNLLRSYEDRAFQDLKGQTLAGAVQRVYHLLPIELRSEHDQHRTRLDLYCSMVLVATVVTVIAVLLLREMPGWTYLAGIIASGAAIAQLCYRAAIASADAYGHLLLQIGRYGAPSAEGPSSGANV